MLQLYLNIKKQRTYLGLTQSDLAEKLGYADKSMIAKIEKGGIDLPQSKILDFANILNISPSELMGWDEPHSISIGDLSESEQELIEGYRQLNDEGQKYIDMQMNLAHTQGHFKKRGTIEKSKRQA